MISFNFHPPVDGAGAGVGVILGVSEISGVGSGVAGVSVGVALGVIAAAAPIKILARPKLSKIFVPWPSLAKIAPETGDTSVNPRTVVADLALNLIVKITPPLPLKPGLGTPPPKLIVPSEFEKEGSVAQSVKIE